MMSMKDGLCAPVNLMKLKYINLISMILRSATIFFTIFLLISLFRGGTSILEIFLLIIIVPSAILDYNLRRCRVCGNHLGKSFFLPRKCPSCGAEINPNDRVNSKLFKEKQNIN